MAHNFVTDGEPEDVSRPHSLIQRGGRWYFNRAFPKELWPITSKAPFRVSLHTDSLEVAKRRLPEAEKRYFAAVDNARAKLAVVEPATMSEIEATALVVQWFREEERSRHESLIDLRRGHFDFDGYLEEFEEHEAEARQSVAEHDGYAVADIVRRLLQENNLKVDRRSAAYRQLVNGLLRGRRELAILDKASRELRRQTQRSNVCSGASAER